MTSLLNHSTSPARERPAVPLAPPAREESALICVMTCVLWIVCALVGAAGLLMPYQRPVPPAKTPPPVTAELISVQLTSDPLPAFKAAPASQNPLPPALPTPAAIPPTPPMAAVAAPSPLIAFSGPAELATQIVAADQASFRAVDTSHSSSSAPALPEVQQLTFGQGEGKQPAPEYPRQSLREGQEGIVTVRMTVREDGRVIRANATVPSPWPLLNEAAVRVVKNRWRFSPGPPRAYEVAIRFQLSK
jgi:protein TonB